MNLESILEESRIAQEAHDAKTRIIVEDNCFYLSTNYKALPERDRYCIEFDRVDTLEKLYVWIFHLTGKGNMNPHTIHHFILAVEEEFGFQMPSMRTTTL
ncbi:MAG: hypothetical protein DRN30_06415 [Thermoplasmata archaeon]|nr:MAG: hypothetical protein DRN30_06415 [Thermoplasmata archaeon]